MGGHKGNIKSWQWWFKWFFKFNQRLGFLPYSWDDEDGRLKVTDSSFQKLIWYIGSIWQLSDTLYLIVTAFTINYSSQSYDAVLKFLVHTISRFGAGFGCVTIFYKMNLSKDLWNHSIAIHRRYKEEYFGDPDAELNEGMVGLVALGTLLTFVHPVIGPFVQFMNERHSIRYWGSQHFPGEFYDSTMGIVLFGGVEILISYISFAGACYPMGMMFVYCGVTKFWLKKLVSPETQKKSLSKKVNMYRTLQVLNVMHNACCGDVWWPLTQNMYLYLHVLINVLLIKYNSFIPTSYLVMLIFASMILTVFEKNCIKSASELYEHSVVVRDKMMSGHRVSRKVGRSFWCVRVQVSSFYCLKMSTFMSYMQALVDQTINVILTFLV